MKKLEIAFDNLFQTISWILMSFIKHLAKFIVPIPPSYYWMQAVSESSGSQVVGIFAAVVLEIGGMLAAHFAIAFYGTAKGKLAAGLTGLYLVIGIGVMWRLESAAADAKLIVTAIFIIAGMVYVLSGMYEIENQEREQIKENRDWERGQIEKDRELERQLKIADKKLKHEERLAKIQAKTKVQKAVVPTSRPHNDQLVGDWRLLSDHQKQQLNELTTKEIENIYDISGSTARRWKQKVGENGYHK